VALDTEPVVPSPADLPLVPLEVDLAGLNDFRGFVSREVDANLRPCSDTIAADHRRGVGFGDQLNRGGIEVARKRYEETLAMSTANMAAYIETAEHLIDTIRHVMRKYSDADLASAAGSAKVNHELTAAMEAASRARLKSLAASRDHSWGIKMDSRADEMGNAG
jgi:hypothetical protein